MNYEGMYDEGMYDEGMNYEGMHDEGINYEGMHGEGMNENMLSSKEHVEVFEIANFIEENKMQIALEYQKHPEENIWKIIAYMFLRKNKSY